MRDVTQTREPCCARSSLLAAPGVDLPEPARLTPRMLLDFVHFAGVSGRLPRHRVTASKQSPSILAGRGPCDPFFSELLRLGGLSSDAYRSSALQRRLPACLRFLRVGDAEAARRRLGEVPELVPQLLDIVLLGVTDFFRDRPVFDYLARAILPGCRGKREPLRVWSAACSDGPELYSVAILLEEAGFLHGATLFGTDVRLPAIRRARQGVFSSEVIARAGLAQSRAFVPHRLGWQVAEHLRGAITWEQHDLLSGAASGPWDFVFWRNMAIYLEPVAAGRVWESILAELAVGGYLITGRADHPPRTPQLEKVAPSIYRKTTVQR